MSTSASTRDDYKRGLTYGGSPITKGAQPRVTTPVPQGKPPQGGSGSAVAK